MKSLFHLQPQHFHYILFSIFIYEEYMHGLLKADYYSIEICYNSTFLAYINLL